MLNNEVERDCNEVYVSGWFEEEPRYSHVIEGECFYKTKIRIARRSGTNDRIQVVIPERVLLKTLARNLYGKYVKIRGEIRSYSNMSLNARMHLALFVFAKQIQICKEEEFTEDCNEIWLKGTICSRPIYRITPLGKEICDVLLKVRRGYNKVSYIPCIAWRWDAVNLSQLQAGSQIEFIGRIQSRQYTKTNPFTGEEEVKTTTEVSIMRPI